MSKREAVPKHSLPPQKQILSYMGRFINCPYAPDTEAPGIFLPRRGSAALGDGAQLSGFKVRADGAVRLLIHAE